MQAKVVYVLVSDPSDYYLEQTVLSILSLKQYNPQAHVALLTDNPSNQNFTGERAIINSIISEKIIVEVPMHLNKMQRSRYIKTSMRFHISGDFLFIDGDTIILKPLNEVDQILADFSATPDKHVTIMNHAWNSSIQRSLRKIGGKFLTPESYYINSGVMFVKDSNSCRVLFKRWNENWIKSSNKGIHSDQPSLAKTINELNFSVNILDGAWNCQITENGLKWYKDAKILHYFASMSKEFTNNEILKLHYNSFFQKIKDNDISYENALNMISCPFMSTITLIGKYESEFRVTAFYKLGYKLFHVNKNFSTILDYMSKIVLKFIK